MENREQLEEVLGLQEVALEPETAWDDLDGADDDFQNWGFAGWCRHTK